MENKVWTDTDGYRVLISKMQDGWSGFVIETVSGSNKNRARVIGVHDEVSALGPRYLLECLRAGKDPGSYREVAGVLIRASAVSFVESVLAEMRAERDKAKAALLEIVSGLKELREARETESQYRGAFTAMMEDESNDGARPPEPVAVPYSELAKQYPVAAAYLKAEAWSEAAHDVQASAGKRAMERIAAGEDFAIVISEMEEEWLAYCDAHALD